MKLVFTFDLQQSLEQTLASARYSRFWDEYREQVIKSFYRNTGLRFTQRKITVHIIDEDVSRAGNAGRPMQLSAKVFDPDRIAGTVIHELAHRLLIGNGIEPSEASESAKQRRNYHAHRHIDLFLYDVLKEVMGQDMADDEVALEKSLGRYYVLAWEWALKMNANERQLALARLKKRHGVKPALS